jgi:hypothetical protein
MNFDTETTQHFEREALNHVAAAVGVAAAAADSGVDEHAAAAAPPQ